MLDEVLLDALLEDKLLAELAAELLPGALAVEELLLDVAWLLDWLAGLLSPASLPPPPPQATSIRLSRRVLQVRRGVRIREMPTGK